MKKEYLSVMVHWDEYWYQKTTKKHFYCRVCHNHIDYCCLWNNNNCVNAIMCAFQKELRG